MNWTLLIALLLGLQVALSDLVARRVSNRVLASVLVTALLLQVGDSQGTPAMTSSLAGGVLGLLCLLPFYAIGWMGAGDVKLFSCIGVLLGVAALLPIWIVASLAAGGHALLVVAWRHVTGVLPANALRIALDCPGAATIQGWRTNLRAARGGRTGIPYAAYLGLAMILWTLKEAGYA